MKKGLVLLPTVLILGFVVVSIGLTGLFIIFTLNRSNYNIRLAANALAAADAGINDAYLRIIRGTNPLSADCSALDPASLPLGAYNLPVGSHNAYVCIQRSGNVYHVFSLGVARGRRRKLKAILDEDARTKQIRLQTINEIPL